MASEQAAFEARQRKLFGSYQALTGLSARSREDLFTASVPVRAERGDVLLREGSHCDPIVLVTEGALRVFRCAPDGREISLYRVEPGDVCVLALCSVLDQRPYGATAAVADPLTGMGIPARTFLALFAAEPALRQLVVSSFARRLDETMTLVSEVAFARVDQRLAQLLLRRWEASGDGEGAVRFTHHELADELGTAREVVSRILRSFADQGVVSLGRGQARILDAEQLRARAPG